MYSVRKKWEYAVVALLISSINLYHILPLYIPVSKPSKSLITEEITLLLVNIRTQNSDYAKTIDYIEKVNPDILGGCPTIGFPEN